MYSRIHDAYLVRQFGGKMTRKLETFAPQTISWVIFVIWVQIYNNTLVTCTQIWCSSSRHKTTSKSSLQLEMIGEWMVYNLIFILTSLPWKVLNYTVTGDWHFRSQRKSNSAPWFNLDRLNCKRFFVARLFPSTPYWVICGRYLEKNLPHLTWNF